MTTHNAPAPRADTIKQAIARRKIVRARQRAAVELGLDKEWVDRPIDELMERWKAEQRL